MSRHSSMRRALRTLALTTVAGFGHLIYPVYLARKTRGGATPQAPEVTTFPPLSVIVPAYLEAVVIQAKVEDVLANGYPGDIEVIVVADDPATAAAARRTSATVVESPTRSGKAAAINRGVQAAAHEAVVLTDANTTLAPGSLEAMARWLADPAVAGVAGEKQVVGERGESLYWRFESWIKQREFVTGSTIGLVGELAALDKSVLSALPEDVTNDDLWIAMAISAAGQRIAYEPLAVATEPEQPLGEEWQRRTRVVAGALDVLWRRRDELVPGATPVVDQLWGHRLIRMTIGPLAHAALVYTALTSVHRSRAARAFLAAHALAARALTRQLRGERVRGPAATGAQVLWLQLVALGGTARFLRRDSTALWPKTERSTRPAAAAAGS